MKTVIIGGSAQSTPALFDTDFAFDAPNFSFELIGRSAERLASITRAVKYVAANRGVRVDCRYSIEPGNAIATADVILLQFRIGGYAARSFDETFPHRFGLVGDEGLGLGGLAAAWRTWLELDRVLKAIERSNPRAIILLLTSPVSLLTRCARRSFPSLALYGICELPWTTLSDICNASGEDAFAASYAYLGVNHLGWFSNVNAGQKTILARDKVIPLKYVRLHERPAEVLAEQLSSRSRGEELSELSESAFEAYRIGSAAQVLAAVRRRGTPWYASAVAPFLHALAGHDAHVTFFLSGTNGDYCAHFAADETIEMPFNICSGKIERAKTADWQRLDIVTTLERLITYERLAARAIRSRDVRDLAFAIRAHPWLDGIELDDDQLLADVVTPVEAVAGRT